ncbi:hypothetical protein IMY05_C2140000100 [Salix suchowensis]|nr:hypothetical protein IMY05_C2140000100 [Salix suchowensis]
MSSNLPFLGSVALQKAKVRPGPPHVSVTRIKYSSPAHGLIAVADLDGTLTIHDAQDLTIIRRQTASQSGSSPNAIRALEWHPKESEIYVGFSNGNVIGYVIDKDMRDHTKDPHHRLSFDGPIYDIAFSPSGSQFAVAYREQVKIVKRRSFVPTLPTISVLELYGPSLPQPRTPCKLRTFALAESYSIPDRTLLLKQDIYEHGVIRKDHI